MGWVDLSTLYVQKSGDTMEGSLVIPQNQTLTCYNDTTAYNVGATLKSLQDSVSQLDTLTSSMSAIGEWKYLYNDSYYGQVSYRCLGKNLIELKVFVVVGSTKTWTVPTKMPSEYRPSENGIIWPALRTTYQGIPQNNLAWVEIAQNGTVSMQALSELTDGCIRGHFLYFIAS